MSDAIPFDSLAVGTAAVTGTGDCVICDAIPFVSLTVGTAAVTGTEEPAPQAPPIPDPTPIPIPDPDPIPVPPPAPPLQPLLYLLSKLLHAPHSRFRQIFNNGQD